MARLAVIGLTYAQPFLIMALTNYVQVSEPNKNDGYGLIGAFALVFLLKGVSIGNPFKLCIISNITFAGLQLSVPTSQLPADYEDQRSHCILDFRENPKLEIR